MAHRRETAFTLIELLIVVAIIAILAAIAVPNFLEAQTRAKVSRAKSDMRTISVALESYAVDNRRYPIGITEGEANGIWTRNDITDDMTLLYKQVTTPIAYISSIPIDEFTKVGGANNGGRESPAYWYDSTNYRNNGYWINAFENGFTWCLRSWGPSREGYAPWPAQILGSTGAVGANNIYDASNGTVSVGYILRTNKGEYTGPG